MGGLAQNVQLVGRDDQYYVVDVDSNGNLFVKDSAGNTLLTSLESYLALIDASLDSLETKTDTVNGNLGDIETYLISTNALLTNIAGFVNDLETLQASTNTKLDTLETTANNIQTATEAFEELSEMHSTATIRKCQEETTDATASAVTLWDPTTDYGCAICHINLSVLEDSYCKIFLDSSSETNMIWGGYLAANMSIIMDFSKPVKGAVNAVLKYTVSTATKHIVCVNGYEWQ